MAVTVTATAAVAVTVLDTAAVAVTDAAIAAVAHTSPPVSAEPALPKPNQRRIPDTQPICYPGSIEVIGFAAASLVIVAVQLEVVSSTW